MVSIIVIFLIAGGNNHLEEREWNNIHQDSFQSKVFLANTAEYRVPHVMLLPLPPVTIMLVHHHVLLLLQ